MWSSPEVTSSCPGGLCSEGLGFQSLGFRTDDDDDVDDDCRRYCRMLTRTCLQMTSSQQLNILRGSCLSYRSHLLIIGSLLATAIASSIKDTSAALVR